MRQADFSPGRDDFAGVRDRAMHWLLVGALTAQGDGMHRLPFKAALRKTIGKEAGAVVHVRIDERIAEQAGYGSVIPL